MMLTKNFDKLQSEVAFHIEHDLLLQGDYWKEDKGGVFKGCFIGCIAHSDDAGHLTREYGLPLPLVRLAEHVFENLEADDAKAFFAAFPIAVGCEGKDLSLVRWAFLSSELKLMKKQCPYNQEIIDDVISGIDVLASGGVWHYGAAYSAPYSVPYSAATAAAASAAASAVSYAFAAARVGASAAYEAAKAATIPYEDAILRQRDTLLRLIAEAPMGVLNRI